VSQLSAPSPTSNKPGGPYRKPRADVFTMLLLISLVALILGIICLYAEMEAYQWEFKGGPTITSVGNEKGTWFVLPERPEGCFAQNQPGPFFVA